MKKYVVIVLVGVFLLTFPCGAAAENTENGLTPIMGEGTLAPEQMYLYLITRNDDNGLNPISDEYAREFVRQTVLVARKEGVNYDVAFALMMHETGFLNYGGDVLAVQNNFGGLGATGGGAAGASFDEPAVGILAVVQHLKCYAGNEALNEECVDPRFSDRLRGISPYVEWLGRADNPSGVGWASPGDGYGAALLAMIDEIAAVDTSGVKKIDVSEKSSAAGELLVNALLILCGALALLLIRRLRRNWLNSL